jgi:hypothetical protein
MVQYGASWLSQVRHGSVMYEWLTRRGVLKVAVLLRRV